MSLLPCCGAQRMITNNNSFKTEVKAMTMNNTDVFNLLSPCFILNEKDFYSNYFSFNKALETKFKNFGIAFSVKTCNFPYLLKLVKKLGGYAEVVSNEEYALAKTCGFEPSSIVYNGMLKDRSSFIEALQQGAIVNIDSKRELQWLKDLPDGLKYKIGMRINVKISNISPERDEKYDDSRFGFSVENSEFDEALKIITSIPNVELVGLHLHRTTSSRDPEFYAKYAVRIIQDYNLSLEYLDFGGGYWGNLEGKPTYSEYVQAIYMGIKDLPNASSIKVFVEPGAAFAASAFSYLSTVIDTKNIRDCQYVVIDGSRVDVDPLFRKANYIGKKFYYNSNNTESEEILPIQIICGSTCIEDDRIFEATNQARLRENDRVLITNVGAYTISFSPTFIRPLPSVYTISDTGSCSLITRS